MIKYSLILIFLILSCTKKNNITEDENTLYIGLSGEVSTLDPATSYDTISSSLIYQSYETLFEYSYLKRPYSLRPLLAEEFPKIENQGKRYIFKIKKNIKYHPDPAFNNKDRFVTAQDFITQIKRVAFHKTNSSGWAIFDGKVVGLNEFRKIVGDDFEKFKKTNVAGLKAIDDSTLIIELNAPYSQMLYAFTMAFTSPVPIEVVEYYNNDLSQNMIGTGPFIWQKDTNNKNFIFTKNSSYRPEFYPSDGDRLAYDKGLLEDAGSRLPFLDKLHFKIILSPQERWNAFIKKEISYIVLGKDNYESVSDNTNSLGDFLKANNIQLQIAPGLTFWWLSFNMTDPILGTNLNLRKAIAHAINFEEYIKRFTNNIGQRANSLYPPGVPGYDPSHELPYSFNQSKAKKFLELAGYPEGKGLPTINYDIRGTGEVSYEQAEFIKMELSKIGIKINIISNTFPKFLEKARTGKLQFWQGGWTLDYPDAENVLQLLFGKNHPPGTNYSCYKNNKFDALFGKLKELPDGEDKRLIMQKIEAIFEEDIPWVMMFYARNYILYHDYLKNFRQSDAIANGFKYLRIKHPYLRQ